MQHNIHIKGHAFALRPIELSDAQFIVDLRTAQPERNQFLHPIPADVRLQEVYIEKYFSTPNDYYFVVERLKTGAPEGLIGIYDINLELKWGVWGRWIIAPNSLAATESCWLICKAAFEHLSLQSVSPQTIDKNESVVSFHDSCGLVRNRFLPDFFCLNGEYYDVIEHILTVEHWNTVVNEHLEAKSKRTADMLNR
jgi:RimJ/RimL family protein N-acetyltransferase